MASWLKVRGDEIDMLVAAAVSRYVWPMFRAKKEAMARAAYYVTKPRRTKYYQCEKCGKDGLRPLEINVHHIVPRIPVTGWDTLEGFIRRTLCEADGLLILCKKCHVEVHAGDQQVRSNNRKKPKQKKARKATNKRKKK